MALERKLKYKKSSLTNRVIPLLFSFHVEKKGRKENSSRRCSESSERLCAHPRLCSTEEIQSRLICAARIGWADNNVQSQRGGSRCCRQSRARGPAPAQWRLFKCDNLIRARSLRHIEFELNLACLLQGMSYSLEDDVNFLFILKFNFLFLFVNVTCSHRGCPKEQ